MAAQEKQTVLEVFHDANVDKLKDLAKLLEAGERYEDMCLVMSKIVSLMADAKQRLDVEQRNMLSVAYKNVIGARRSTWRVLTNEEENLVDKPLRDKYKKIIEDELTDKCREILDLLEKKLISGEKFPVREPNKEPPTLTKDQETNLEVQVFYLKMAGDYYRYLSEFAPSESNQKKTIENYEEALKIADNMKATHPTRLGLALNASVCYYEIMKEPKKACSLAKDHFDEAIQKLDTLNDATYKDSTLIMQLLRDNLTIWSSEGENQEED